MTERYSAPGKLFLVGEYAVLCGAPSLVAAVDRRVHVLRRTEPGERYDVTGGEVSDDELVKRVLEACDSELTPEWFASDLTELYRDDVKLGLGSSAASAVALTAAVLADDADRDRIFELARDAHAAFQEGKGSGADIAAATYGGVCVYQRPPVAEFPAYRKVVEEPRIARDLAWPDDLRIEAFWLGEPASSSELVSRLQTAVSEGGDDVLAVLSQMGDQAVQFVAAFRNGDVDTLVEKTLGYGFNYDRLGQFLGVDLAVPAHRALQRRAEELDLAARPCGAGAGDFSIVVGPTDAQWGALLDDLPEQCHHVELKMGASGVTRNR